VEAKIRLDNYSTEDFGASALITPINLNYSYMIPDAMGKMQEISENIFRDIFSRHMKLEQKSVEDLDVIFLIPQLIKLWPDLSEAEDEDEEDEDERTDVINVEQIYDGCIIVPRNGKYINFVYLA
jgi:hypothetical protein